MESQVVAGVLFSEVAPIVRLVHHLPPMEANFVYALAAQKKRNATKAAEEAGFSKKTAAQAASRLLRNVKVKAAIDEMLSQVHQKLDITVERIRYELACSAFFDPSWIKNPDGSIKPWAEWPEHARRAMPTIDACKLLKTEKGADGVTLVVEMVDHEVRVPGKSESLKMLGQEKRMFSADDAPPSTGRFIFVTGESRADGKKS